MGRQNRGKAMYSIIDIGSNTIRLKVYAVEGSKIKTVFQSKDMTGLANYITEENHLSCAGIERACAVLREYAGILDSLGIGNRAVFATASLPGWRYWQAGPAAQSRFCSFFTSVEYQSSHRHFAPVAVTGDPLKRSPASLPRSAPRGSPRTDRDDLW